MMQALVSGLVVIPAAWLTMGSGVNSDLRHPAAIRRHVPAGGAVFGGRRPAMGVSVGQTQIGLMFSMVITPMMMFGCAYYPVERARFRSRR